MAASTLLLVACGESTAGGDGVAGTSPTTSSSGGAGGGQGGTGGTAATTTTTTGAGGGGGEGGTTSSPGCNPGNSDTFTDDFDDGVLDSNWQTFGDATIEETGGQLQLTLAPGSEGGVSTIASYDLRGCSVSARFATAPGSGSMALTFRHGSQTRIVVGARGTTLYAFETIANSPTFSGTQPISTGFTGYLRIREQGGGIYFEYSTNGQSWSRVFTASSAPDIDTSSTAEDGTIELSATPPQSASSDVVRAFDDLNLP